MFARDFASAVKRARARLGLTQQALALACGLSRQTVAQVEAGTFSDLGVRKVERMLAVLDLSLAVSGVASDAQATAIARAGDPSAGSRLGRLLADRAAKRRQRALELARRTLSALRKQGVSACVVGSLAKGRFRADSDVDYLVELVRRELANATEANRRFLALKKRYPALYHEWSHNASLADGVSAIYTGCESVLEAIGNEIDEYAPRGDASHADLVDGMAVAVRGVRPAVLRELTRELMHEARKFRHVARHKYALHLKMADVARNLRLAKKLVPAFEKDYRRFAALMLEA